MRVVRLKLLHFLPLLGLFNVIKKTVYHKSENLHKKAMLHKNISLTYRVFSLGKSFIEIHVTISCLECLWEYCLLADLAVDRPARSSDLKEWGEYVDRR